MRSSITRVCRSLAWAVVIGLLVAPIAARAVPAAAAASRGPTTLTMHGHSAVFDMRKLPQVGRPRSRPARPEKEAPTTPLSPPGRPAPIGSGVASGALTPAPPPSSSFEGLHYTQSCGITQCGDGHPPDTNGDVGPTYY